MASALTRLNRRFPRKRAFITGAASGLGLALARQLIAEGWSLGLFDRDEGRLTRVEAEFSAAGAAVLAYPGDVTHSDELTVAVNSFADSHDGLDLMINNAGVAACGMLMEVELSDWRWILDINFLGVLHGARAAVPHLQRHGNGLMINVASAAAFASLPGMGPYNASKAAVLALSETLHNELKPSGIHVAAVMPMFFRTHLLDTFRGPDTTRQTAANIMNSSRYTAEACADDLLRRAARGHSHIVLPAAGRWLWRLKRWTPRLYFHVLDHFTHRLRRGTGASAEDRSV
jgi:NADP-dependent 3-hydroxy acid dehydrogenase YdfG